LSRGVQPGGRLKAQAGSRGAEAYGPARSKAHGYQTFAWRKVSRQVLERDRLCTRCGARPSEVAHHVAGLRPRNPGGLDVGTCAACAVRATWRFTFSTACERRAAVTRTPIPATLRAATRTDSSLGRTLAPAARRARVASDGLLARNAREGQRRAAAALLPPNAATLRTCGEGSGSMRCVTLWRGGTSRLRWPSPQPVSLAPNGTRARQLARWERGFRRCSDLLAAGRHPTMRLRAAVPMA
jgi:hypothetical protein